MSAAETHRRTISGENGWFVPQTDGSVKWVDKADGKRLLRQIRANRKRGRDGLVNDVDFYLYTRANPKNAQEIEDEVASIKASNFNPKNPTRFVIHGFNETYTADTSKEITKAWLSRGDFNIIVVDWSSSRLWFYPAAAEAVEDTGEEVADFIDFLVKKFGMSLGNLVVIGHSLGAHVAGFAGKNVKSGKIHTIIGLDPALPFFDYDDPDERLAANDAIYVESIHTNGGYLGFLKPIGRASFYADGGDTQPACDGLEDLFGCSHLLAPTYYAEGIMYNNFPTIKCNSYKDAENERCGKTYCSVKMANPNPDVKASGVYFVPVKSQSPYGMG